MRQIVLALALVASPAMADWQYTKWGMTVDQAVAASGGAVAAIPPQPGAMGATLRASGAYTADIGAFDAKFGFNASGGLASVVLELRDKSACFRLRQPLEDKYGAADVRPTRYGRSMRWRDTVGGNAIQLFDEADNRSFPACQLSYRPLIGEASGGL